MKICLQIIPADNSDRISPPTPEPSPVLARPVRSVSRRVYPRIPSDCNLSTITEEPTQYSSQEVIVQPSVIVQPEVIVETTLPGQATFSTNSNSSRNVSFFNIRLFTNLLIHISSNSG